MRPAQPSRPVQAGPSTPAVPAATSLNLASFLPKSRVNGPGERAVLWLQGCPLRCRGCYNPGFLPIREAGRFSVATVAEVIVAIESIEGVTYSGGEPTLQALPLATLSEMLHRAGLSVMCYTGFRHEQLVAAADPDVRALLEQVDLLADGPYEADKAPGGRWRGSSNQRLIALSERYRDLAAEAAREGVPAAGPEPVPEAASEDTGAEVEIFVGDRAALWTGVFPGEVAREAERLLPGRQTGTRRKR